MEVDESALSDFETLGSLANVPLHKGHWGEIRLKRGPRTKSCKREQARMAARLQDAERIAEITPGDEIEKEANRYFEATARDGILHQSEEGDLWREAACRSHNPALEGR